MLTILIESAPDAARLAQLSVENWLLWEKEISEFPWEYADTETCYILQGRVIVTPADAAPVEIARGNLVTFPTGLVCTWKIIEPLRKRYRFG